MRPIGAGKSILLPARGPPVMLGVSARPTTAARPPGSSESSRGNRLAEREELDAESRARERLVFALRRLEGISRQAFERDTGYSVDMLAGEAIARFVAYGLLNDTGQQIALTREGLMVSDAMWPELV